MELASGDGLRALLSLPGIGPTKALSIASAYPTWQALAAADAQALSVLVGPAAARTARAGLFDRPPVPNPLPPGVRVVSLFDDAYPAPLRLLADAPPLLWYRGSLPDSTPSVALVGTRTPTHWGQSFCRTVGRDAANNNVPVVSGLADGCDNISTVAALNAGGVTFVYLGQGVDTLTARTPRAQLAERIIASGGGVLAEVPPGTGPRGAHLARRNRLQSGTATATVICQSGLPGPGSAAGTMYTARFALAQNRLLVVPRPDGAWAIEPESAGNLALTNPGGCDPVFLHARTAEQRLLVEQRRPVADLVLSTPDDIQRLWQALPDRAAAVASAAPVSGATRVTALDALF